MQPAIRRSFTMLWLAASLLLLPGCNGCRNGLTSAHPVALPDGTVVLVRDRTGYGAFVLLNQQIGNAPESVDYAWFYRTNGGAFATNDPAVQFGSASGTTQKSIDFTNFAVPWSGAAAGYGWLYYPRNQHGSGSRGTWELCVTTETNPAAIRPDDPKWHYRSRPPFSWAAEKRWFESLWR